MVVASWVPGNRRERQKDICPCSFPFLPSRLRSRQEKLIFRSKENSFVCLALPPFAYLGPHLQQHKRERKRQSVSATTRCRKKKGSSHTERVKSQLPVHRAMPSEDTPRHDTLFSCFLRVEHLSALRASHTRQLWSSYPAKRYRPLLEKATDVTLHKIVSSANTEISRPARISKRRQDWSSEPEPKACLSGKYLN